MGIFKALLPEVFDLIVDKFALFIQLSPLFELPDELLTKIFKFIDSSLVLVNPLLENDDIG